MVSTSLALTLFKFHTCHQDNSMIQICFPTLLRLGLIHTYICHKFEIKNSYTMWNKMKPLCHEPLSNIRCTPTNRESLQGLGKCSQLQPSSIW